MYTMRLVKWQRNVIFKAVEDGGLDPRECTFEYDDAKSRITHRLSQSYFLLEGSPLSYTVTAVVGDNPSLPLASLGWTAATDRVGRWARDVKEDVDTPDLWAELQRDREALTVGPYEDAENSPFTPAEQAEIAEQLRLIKDYVRTTYTFSVAQMASLDEKLDMIRAAATRMGRQDWRVYVGGLLLGVILQDLVPADVVQHIFVMMLQAVTHVLAPQFSHLLTP